MGGCCGSQGIATSPSGAYAHSPLTRGQSKGPTRKSGNRSAPEGPHLDQGPSSPKPSPGKSGNRPAPDPKLIKAKSEGKKEKQSDQHTRPANTAKEGSSKDHIKALSAAKSIDDFELMSVLGTGQFGCVKLARHKMSGAACAMKLCHSGRGHQIDKGGAVYESLAGKLLPKIDHRCVIRTYTTFWGGDQIYTCMELADGGDLEKHLRCAGKFSNEEARFYTAQVSLGLDAIHKLGVVLHDLKPDNCLLTKDGQVKLIDFGLAGLAQAGNRKSCTTFGGSPAYMAPEIHDKQPHDGQCDWWSVGVMLWEMLVGSRPNFDDDWDAGTYPSVIGGSAKDLLKALLVEDPSHRISARGGGSAVTQHKFFSGLSMSALAKGSVRPPRAAAGRSALGNAGGKQSGFQAATNAAGGGTRRFTIGESSTTEGIKCTKRREEMKGTVANRKIDVVFEQARKRRSAPGR